MTEKIEKNVICVVLVAIRRGNDILLLKRENEPLKGYWGLIGGKLKDHEGIEHAAIREAKEETGMDVDFIAIRGVLHERLYDEERHKYGLMLFLTECIPKTFDIQESYEGEVKWFSLKKLEKRKIILSDLWMVNNLLDEKTRVRKVIMREKNRELFDMKVEEYGD